MIDGGEAGTIKIIARWQLGDQSLWIVLINDIDDHLLICERRLSNSFEDYKKLENKEVKVEDFPWQEMPNADQPREAIELYD